MTDARCRGLCIRVTEAGEKTWAFRYRDSVGRTQRLTLGRYPDLGLGAARDRADQQRRAVANGGSPAAAKKQERLDAERLTFDHLADRYLHEYAYRFKRSAAEDDRSIRLHLRPVWGSRRYRDIRRSDVVEVVEKIYSSGRPALAVRLKATASKLFAFAISKGLLENNPAAGIGRIAETVARKRVLSDEEIRLFWRAVVCSPVSLKVGLALRLVLITGQRPGEVAGLRRSEVSLDDPRGATWRLPTERTKNRREHVVPLTQQARAAIQQALHLGSNYSGQPAREADDRVFPSPRGAETISSHALAVAMARLCRSIREENAKGSAGDAAALGGWLIDPPTPHDLRRTAATRMRELGVTSDDVKRVLNHAQTGVLGRHYDHYDALREKRYALSRWGAEIERIISDEPRNVVQLRAGAPA